MAPSDFSNADIPSIVEKLTLEEAIALIAGVGFWKTHEVPRLGIPAVKVYIHREIQLSIISLTPINIG